MMDFFLSNQSPNTPAIGDRMILGRIDIANIEANMVAEPVIAKTYKDKTNCCMLLPSRETKLPIINNI